MTVPALILQLLAVLAAVKAVLYARETVSEAKSAGTRLGELLGVIQHAAERERQMRQEMFESDLVVQRLHRLAEIADIVAEMSHLAGMTPNAKVEPTIGRHVGETPLDLRWRRLDVVVAIFEKGLGGPPLPKTASLIKTAKVAGSSYSQIQAAAMCALTEMKSVVASLPVQAAGTRHG